MFTLTLNPDQTLQNSKLLLVFGAGGHGRVLGEAALLQDYWASVMACARNLPAHVNELVPGVKLIDIDEAMQMDATVHIAIGNNTARQTEAQALGLVRLVSVVHPRASVSAFSHIGAGCFVAAGAVVAPAAKLGMDVIVNHAL